MEVEEVKEAEEVEENNAGRVMAQRASWGGE
jgi:hypothetical protein